MWLILIEYWSRRSPTVADEIRGFTHYVKGPNSIFYLNDQDYAISLCVEVLVMTLTVLTVIVGLLKNRRR